MRSLLSLSLQYHHPAAPAWLLCPFSFPFAPFLLILCHCSSSTSSTSPLPHPVILSASAALRAIPVASKQRPVRVFALSLLPLFMTSHPLILSPVSPVSPVSLHSPAASFSSHIHLLCFCFLLAAQLTSPAAEASSASPFFPILSSSPPSLLPTFSLAVTFLVLFGLLVAMTVDDAVMQKLWKLTNELTAQLVFNRNATLELKQQLADLQAKTTVQGSVTFASDTTQTRSQGHADYTLRIANERLLEENSQLQEQLREYERWMEYIMSKFRLQNFAMAQSRKEAMHEAYRMAEQEGELTHRLQDENAILQARLVEVGAIARKAITDECYNTESVIETLERENQGLREMLGVAVDHANIMATQYSGNRVSFPSTGSYMASSGSDQEPQHGFEHAPDVAAREEAALASSPEPVPNVVDKLESVSSSQLNQAEKLAEKVGAEAEVTAVVDRARKAKANAKKPTETASTPIKSSINHNQNTVNTNSSSTKASNGTDVNTNCSTSTNNSQSSKSSKTNGTVDGKGAGTGAGVGSPGSKRNSITNNSNPGSAAKSTAAGNTSTSQKPKKLNRKQKA